MSGLKDKIVILTGGSRGIGAATAREMAPDGPHLILCARTAEACEGTKAAVEALGAKAECHGFEVADTEVTKAFIDDIIARHGHVDVLINNAGAYPTRQQFTQEGFELQFGVNYLGHFLLTHLLLPALQVSGDARIVHLSSIMHHLGKIDESTFKGRKKYSGTAAYGQSKLANLLFSNALAKRLPSDITSNAVHPGGVDSDIYRELPTLVYKILRLFLISTERAGAYVADMAVSPKWQGRNGEFKAAHGPLPVSRRGRDAALADELYEKSCELAGVTAI